MKGIELKLKMFGLIGLMAVVFLSVPSRITEAQVSNLLNFQGKVTNTDGSEVADNVYDLTFELFTTRTGGAAIWSEDLSAANVFSGNISSVTANADSITYGYSGGAGTSTLRLGQTLNYASSSALVIDYDTGAETITVATGSPIWAIGDSINNRPFIEGGVIDVNLGAVSDLSAVDFNQTLYLEITFNGETMQPRKILTTKPQAFEAAQLGGKTGDEFAALADNETITGQWRFENILNINATSTSPALTVTQNGSGNLMEVKRGASTTFAVLADGRVQIGNYYFPTTHGAAGYTLKTDISGNLYWGVDYMGTGGAGLWSTSTNEQIIFPVDSVQVIVIGNNATSTTDSALEVIGNAYINGNITVTGTVDGVDISALSPYMITTAGTWGQLWMSDGSGVGTWTATSGLAIALSDTTGVLAVNRGGTGTTTTPSYGQVLIGNGGGGYSLVATSTLGLLSSMITLNDLSDVDTTGVGYGNLILYNGSSWVDTATSTLGLENILAFNAPLYRSGNNIYTYQASSTANGYLSMADWSAFNNKISSSSLSAVSPLSYNSASGQFTILTANSSQAGALSSSDWISFNNKMSSSTIAALTAGYVPYWNTNIFANSNLYNSGTNIGIGTTSPTFGLLDINGNLAIENQNSLRIYETRTNGSNYVGFTATSSLASDTTYTWPVGGSNGQALILGDNGNMYWGNPTGSGVINSASLAGQVAYYAAIGNTISATSSLFINNTTGSIGIGTTTPTLARLDINADIALENQQALKLYEARGNGINFVAFTATSSLASDSTYTWPVAGTNGQALLLGDSGNLYWGNPTGSGVINSGSVGQIAYYGSAGQVVSGTSTIFINTTNYNVGIGTTTANNRLSVDGYGNFSNGICISGNCITNWGSAGAIDGSGTDGRPAFWVDSNTLGATSTLSIVYGGTGLSALPAYGQMLVGKGDGTYDLKATSTLGLMSSLATINDLSDVTITGATFGDLLMYNGTNWADVATSSLGLENSLTFNVPLYRTGNNVYIYRASSTANGYLSMADWNLFNNKISSSSLSGTAPIQYNSSTGAITILTANGSQAGALSAADWTTFYQKMGSSTISSLTTNRVPYWTGSIFSDSEIYYNSTNVGIGTTTLTEKLNLEGRLNATGLCINGNCIASWGAAGAISGSGTVGQPTYWISPTQIGATSTMSIVYGGTGLSVHPVYGQILLGTAAGSYQLTATSSLGLENPLAFNTPLYRSGNNIYIYPASSTAAGYISIADWNLFNSKISSTSLSGTAPIQYNSSTGAISILAAGSGQAGALSAADWNFFNQKVSSTSLSAIGPLSYDSATGQFTILTANGSQAGALSSSDWTVFNNKMSSSSIASLNANRIPYWTGAIFNDTNIYYNATNVGVGTTTPTLGLLDVNGNLAIENKNAIQLYETRTNGVNYVAFSATSSLASDTTYTWPANGVNGQALLLGDSGNLYWGNPTGSGVIGSASLGGQVAYYAGAGNVIAATSSIFISPVTSYVGIGTTTPTALLTVGYLGGGFMIDENGYVIRGVWQGSPVEIAYGGTGANSAAGARSNLGLSDVYEYGVNTVGTSGWLWQSDGDGRGRWIATTSLGIGEAATESTFIGTTTYTTDGSIATSTLRGYQAANDICNAEYAGSHFCRTNEILATIIVNNISAWGTDTSNAWIAEGPPGYTYDSNDCNGYIDNSGSKLGAFWLFNADGGGAGWLVNCSMVKSLACCKAQ